jgi:hypothetical protein
MTTMADLGGTVVRGSHVHCSNLTLRSSPQGHFRPWCRLDTDGRLIPK